ncbi:MAG: hypothetical protein ACPGYY_08395 [Bacteroidia bacterium]
MARSILELETDSQALYLPRLTTTQRDNQSGWKDGMVIYNTTLSCIQFFEGTEWNCLASIPGIPNLDADSTNELMSSLVISNDTLYLTEADSTFSVKLVYAPTYLCKEVDGNTLTYRLQGNGNLYLSEADTSDKRALNELLDSGYLTCESGQNTIELTDCKRRERMSDNSSVIVYFNDSVDVFSTAGVIASYSDYDTWFGSSGLSVSSVLNCFDEVCLQIGNVQYVDFDGDNLFDNIDNSADVKSYSTLIGLSAVACTPISCQQVYGPSDFGLDGISGLPDTDPGCVDLSATWYDGSTGELFSWDVTGALWVQQPSISEVSCPQGAFPLRELFSLQ